MNMTQPIIKVNSISKRFGGNKAVDHVSIDIPKGSILGLIGPNGSGKTTVLNMLSGELMPDEGTVFLENLDITGKSPSSLVQLGVTRMFQMTKVFVRLSALDNLLIAGQALGLKKDDCLARADMLIKELTLQDVQYLDAVQGCVVGRAVCCGSPRDATNYESIYQGSTPKGANLFIGQSRYAHY